MSPTSSQVSFKRGSYRVRFRETNASMKAKVSNWSDALGMWRNGTCQGTFVASRSWQDKEADSPLDPPEEMQACQHLDFS